MTNIWKLIGLMMIILIIGIPFHVSFAFADAGSLTGLNITGSDGKNNVLQDTDKLKLSVTAKMTDDTGATESLNENNVRMVYNGYEEKFSRCTDQGGGTFLCEYTSGDREWERGKNNVEIKLYDNYFFKLATLDGSFYVDSAPPTIREFGFSKDPDNTIEASYDVADTACSGCGDFCSGLDRVEFSFDGVLEQTVKVGEGCEKSSNISFSPESLGLDEGTRQFCIAAYDAFGAESSSCKSLYLDYNPPVISGLEVTHDGLPLKYTSAVPMDAVVSVNVSDAVSGVSQKNIWADLSALNTVNPQGYGRMMPDCSGTANNLECTWDVMVDGVDGSAKITVNATDNSGLSASLSRTLSLPMDTDAPSVISLGSGHAGENGTKFLKKDNNTLDAQIDETGSGMGNALAYLNLFNMNNAYGSVQADDCNSTGGIWHCFWGGLSVAGKLNGQKMDVQVQSLKDDAGNSWQGTEGIAHQTFVYDDEKPVFENITIKPYGADIDVLRETDIASVKAYIREQYSGLKAENVLADFSQFNSEINYSTPADSCDDMGNSTWECDWEYTGNYDAGQTARVDIRATDNAGNTKDSAADHVFGSIYIAKVTAKNVDYWEPEAESYDVNKLNRNFLYMSSSGTIIRAGVRLVANTAKPYVHEFRLTSCQGSLAIPSTDDVFTSYTVKDEFYYPDADRSDKYVLIEVPHYDNSSLSNATAVKIICAGEVVQGRSKTSDVYTPNEIVNVTIDVPLTNKIFSSPGLSTIDKITEKKSQLDSLNTLINWIDFWVRLLQPLCQLFQLLRQLIEGVCVFIQGFEYLKGGVSSCALQSWKLDKYWYGYTDEQMNDKIKDVDASSLNHQQKIEALFNQNVKGNFLPQSTKKVPSIGWVCDFVICEDCDDFWASKLGNTLSNTMNGYMQSIFPSAVHSYGQFVFDPQKSLIVSVWCSPPCMPGILAKLKTYKAILITYNVCVNTASVNPNMDVSQCDDYYDTQVCDQIVGEFWYLVDEFIKSYIVNFAIYGAKKMLAKAAGCPKGWTSNPVTAHTCTAYEIYAAVGWFIHLSETVDTLNQIFNHKFFSQSDEETEKNAKEKITGVTENDKQFVRQT